MISSRIAVKPPIDYNPLAPLRFARFTLHLEATTDHHLPRYKGSTLRGGFGNALKKVLCTTKTFDCPPCLLQNACPYIGMFEPKVDKSIADLLRIGRDAQQPFVLEPPLTEQQEFSKGETFSVDLILIGKAMEMLPYFIYAFLILGEKVGLGKQHGRFALRLIKDAEGRKIYDGATEQLAKSYRVFTLSEFISEERSASRVNLNFLTPTRIMTSSGTGARHLMRPRSGDDFWTIIESLYHRVFVLTNLYCSPVVAEYLQYKPPLQSRPVRLAASNIRWQDWERISYRQQTRMKLGGFVGNATFEGDLAPYLPLLHIGSHLHLGKNTTFGLGKFDLSP